MKARLTTLNLVLFPLIATVGLATFSPRAEGAEQAALSLRSELYPLRYEMREELESLEAALQLLESRMGATFSESEHLAALQALVDRLQFGCFEINFSMGRTGWDKVARIRGAKTNARDLAELILQTRGKLREEMELLRTANAGDPERLRSLGAGLRLTENSLGWAVDSARRIEATAQEMLAKTALARRLVNAMGRTVR